MQLLQTVLTRRGRDFATADDAAEEGPGLVVGTRAAGGVRDR